MSFKRSVLVSGITYRLHEAVGISHERGGRTVVHVVSHESGGGNARDSWHERELDDSLTFEAAEEWLQSLDAFAEHEDPYQAAVEQLAPSLTDEQASTVAWAYPEWAEGESYEVGTRIRHDGVLYKVLQAHSSQAGWTPDAAPSLFAKVLSEPEVDPETSEETYPEWQQPDSTNAYMIGDRVLFEGVAYESTIDGNVWSPSAYPAGWKEV